MWGILRLLGTGILGLGLMAVSCKSKPSEPPADAGRDMQRKVPESERPENYRISIVVDEPSHVWSVDFSPDGKQLASAHIDDAIRIWDFKLGHPGRVLKKVHETPIRAVAFSPDAKWIASCGDDLVIRIREVATGNEIKAFSGHKDLIVGIDFHPEGTRLVTASRDGSALLWDMRKKKKHIGRLKEHEDSVTAAVYNRDGQKLLTSSCDNTIKIWNPERGKVMRTLQGHEFDVNSAAFSPDNQYVVSGDGCTGCPEGEIGGTVILWDALTGKLLKKMVGHTAAITSVAYSPDGKVVASAGLDKTVRIWEVPSGKLKHVLKGHDNWILDLDFHPKGHLLASGSEDRTIRVWDVRKGELVVGMVAFLPDEWIAWTKSKHYACSKKGCRRVEFKRGRRIRKARTEPYLKHLHDIKKVRETLAAAGF